MPVISSHPARGKLRLSCLQEHRLSKMAHQGPQNLLLRLSEFASLLEQLVIPELSLQDVLRLSLTCKAIKTRITTKIPQILQVTSSARWSCIFSLPGSAHTATADSPLHCAWHTSVSMLFCMA